MTESDPTVIAESPPYPEAALNDVDDRLTDAVLAVGEAIMQARGNEPLVNSLRDVQDILQVTRRIVGRR